MLKDFRASPLGEKDKALLTLVEQVNRDPAKIRQADIDAAKSAGWCDEALYDAIMVCALFRFMNTWVDATGVDGLPAEAYAVRGTRLAKQGYRPGRAE